MGAVAQFHSLSCKQYFLSIPTLPSYITLQFNQFLTRRINQHHTPKKYLISIDNNSQATETMAAKINSNFQFQSIGPDSFLVCSSSQFTTQTANRTSSQIIPQTTITPPTPPTQSPAKGSTSPRRRQAQFTLQPIRTQSLPHEIGYTPTTPRFMRYKEISTSTSLKYSGILGRGLHAKLHGFMVGWLCGV